jgi:hypothetical protein
MSPPSAVHLAIYCQARARTGAARERQRALCTWPAVGQAAEQRHEQAAGAPQLARLRAPVGSSDALMSPRLRALVARAAPALRP